MIARITLIFAALAFGALLLGGCIHTKDQGWQLTPTGKKAVAVAGDVLECAAADYDTARHAIERGGNASIGDWLSALIGVFPCISRAVADIKRDDAIALLLAPTSYMLASEADDMAPPPMKALSKRARQRLAAAEVLGEVLNRNMVAK